MPLHPQVFLGCVAPVLEPVQDGHAAAAPLYNGSSVVRGFPAVNGRKSPRGSEGLDISLSLTQNPLHRKISFFRPRYLANLIPACDHHGIILSARSYQMDRSTPR
jgi:hypothetical protein